MEFSKLNHHVRKALKKIFIVKKIYISTSNGHIDQYLANLVINKQPLAWDKYNLYKYRIMYLMSKA